MTTMNDREITRTPPMLDRISSDTSASGFTMASDLQTGALLAALTASKPGGRILELGTGTGIGTSWLLSGMDAAATLDTVDVDEAVVAIARRHLGSDPRVTFHVLDGADFIARSPKPCYDLIYADAWPGKFSHLDDALALLDVGGIYFIDDLLPQPNWPDGHAPKVPALIEAIEHKPGFTAVRLAWSSGLMIVVRRALT
jgi:predicted O-methyltransferase YrrM